MRPVERGPAPRRYARYRDAARDLTERLGRYCSYCERRLPASLHVEHVVPKSLEPARETDWSNFLLGCANCNSAKLDKPVDLAGTLWPDRDNTFLAYRYAPGGYVGLAPGLRGKAKRAAERLASLVGLLRHGGAGAGFEPAPRDERWIQREEVWAAAEYCRRQLADLGHSDSARSLVAKAAAGWGFFSVWMAVFADDRETRLALVEAFRGTAAAAFGSDGEPRNRPGGIL